MRIIGLLLLWVSSLNFLPGSCYLGSGTMWPDWFRVSLMATSEPLRDCYASWGQVCQSLELRPQSLNLLQPRLQPLKSFQNLSQRPCESRGAAAASGPLQVPVTGGRPGWTVPSGSGGWVTSVLERSHQAAMPLCNLFGPYHHRWPWVSWNECFHFWRNVTVWKDLAGPFFLIL